MHGGSCPRHQMHTTRLSSSIGRAIYTILPIVVTLMLLPTIAFATPPDPWWVAGLYDGADGDDVVSLVYEAGGIESGFFQLLPPHLRPSERQCLSRPGLGRAFSVGTLTRGPPSTSDFDLLPPQLLSLHHHLTLHRATPVSPPRLTSSTRSILPDEEPA